MGADQPGGVLLQLLRRMDARPCDVCNPTRSAQIRRPGPAGRIGRRRLAAQARAPANPRSHPRGTARNVLFYEISGAISHVESFDFKENAGTPKDLDVRRINDNVSLSAPALPAHGEAHRQVRHPALHAQPRRGALPRPVLHADRPPVEPGLRARDSLHRLGDRHGTGTAPPPERHLPHLHVVQPRQGLPRRALHRLPAAAILRGRYQSRCRRQRHGAR